MTRRLAGAIRHLERVRSEKLGRGESTVRVDAELYELERVQRAAKRQKVSVTKSANAKAPRKQGNAKWRALEDKRATVTAEYAKKRSDGLTKRLAISGVASTYNVADKAIRDLLSTPDK
jgi:hypothetical protein